MMDAIADADGGNFPPTAARGHPVTAAEAATAFLCLGLSPPPQGARGRLHVAIAVYVEEAIEAAQAAASLKSRVHAAATHLAGRQGAGEDDRATRTVSFAVRAAVEVADRGSGGKEGTAGDLFALAAFMGEVEAEAERLADATARKRGREADAVFTSFIRALACIADDFGASTAAGANSGLADRGVARAPFLDFAGEALALACNCADRVLKARKDEGQGGSSAIKYFDSIEALTNGARDRALAEKIRQALRP